jgi:hypothetical protein
MENQPEPQPLGLSAQRGHAAPRQVAADHPLVSWRLALDGHQGLDQRRPEVVAFGLSVQTRHGRGGTPQVGAGVLIKRQPVDTLVGHCVSPHAAPACPPGFAFSPLRRLTRRHGLHQRLEILARDPQEARAANPPGLQSTLSDVRPDRGQSEVQHAGGFAGGQPLTLGGDIHSL